MNWKTKYELGSPTVPTMKTPMPGTNFRLSRRLFLKRSGVASLGLTSRAGWQLPSPPVRATEAPANEPDRLHDILNAELQAVANRPSLPGRGHSDSQRCAIQKNAEHKEDPPKRQRAGRQ